MEFVHVPSLSTIIQDNVKICVSAPADALPVSTLKTIAGNAQFILLDRIILLCATFVPTIIRGAAISRNAYPARINA